MARTVAVVEAAVPPAVGSALDEMGCEVRSLPPAEGKSEARVLGEAVVRGCDFLVLPNGPRLAERLRVLAAMRSRPRVLVAASHASGPGGGVIDLWIPPGTGAAAWLLAFITLEPPLPPAATESPPALVLLRVIDLANRAFASLADGVGSPPVRGDFEDELLALYRGLLARTVAGIERSIDGFDGSSSRVSRLARDTAFALGLGAKDARVAEMAGGLRDVAMHLVPGTRVLGSPDPLTSSERRVLCLHPASSASAAGPAGHHDPVTAAIGSHHERLDGSGYPMKGTGSAVGIAARIVAASDTFDALVHPRPFRRRTYEPMQALVVLREEAGGRRLDRTVVEALAAAITRGDDAMSSGVAPAHTRHA